MPFDVRDDERGFDDPAAAGDEPAPTENGAEVGPPTASRSCQRRRRRSRRVAEQAAPTRSNR